MLNIMAMFLEKAKLTYVSVPKCACSSLKRVCHEANTGEPFRKVGEDGVKRSIHGVYGSPRFRRVRRGLKDGRFGGDLIAVVRNPLDRILSCYTNKVADKGCLRTADASEFARLDVPQEPDLATFVDNLEAYREISPEVRRHSQPLTWFLGRQPGRYLSLFDMSRLQDFVELVNERAASQVVLSHYNPSPNAVRISTVAPAVAQKVDTIFAEDHEIFGAYFEPSRKSVV